MKNHLVKVTRYFFDKTENLPRSTIENSEFRCTKERYEFLKENNAVKLIKVLEDKKEETKQPVKRGRKKKGE